MARVSFTKNLERLVACPSGAFDGETVGAVLAHAFEAHPAARGYVLDEQGALRKHVIVFVDGKQLGDRQKLSDPVGPDSELHVMQALSGG